MKKLYLENMAADVVWKDYEKFVSGLGRQLRVTVARRVFLLNGSKFECGMLFCLDDAEKIFLSYVSQENTGGDYWAFQQRESNDFLHQLRPLILPVETYDEPVLCILNVPKSLAFPSGEGYLDISSKSDITKWDGQVKYAIFSSGASHPGDIGESGFSRRRFIEIGPVNFLADFRPFMACGEELYRICFPFYRSDYHIL